MEILEHFSKKMANIGHTAFFIMRILIAGIIKFTSMVRSWKGGYRLQTTTPTFRIMSKEI
jgi:hypothetical protein